MNNKIYIIAITGGSGSGKTFLCNKLIKKFGGDKILKIEVDSYYKNLAHLEMEEREKNNFDHPNAIDFDLMYNDIKLLANNSKIIMPIYDYTKHIRKEETRIIENKKIIIIEGIFALFDQRIRGLLNLKIYVDTPADIRIIRRIKRDINKRDRELSSIIKQYYSTVRPMHTKFVEPTKQYADIILNEGGKNPIAINLIKDNVNKILMEENG